VCVGEGGKRLGEAGIGLKGASIWSSHHGKAPSQPASQQTQTRMPLTSKVRVDVGLRPLGCNVADVHVGVGWIRPARSVQGAVLDQ